MQSLNKNFTFPFKPHEFQVEAKHVMEMRDCSLLKFKVGLGKTFASILAALQYSLDDGVEQILILCPPILIDQWYNFLMSIKGIPSVRVYRGTPAQRAAMEMDESIIIASYNIFRGKKDHKRFVSLARQSTLCIIADELSLKSLKSQTYRRLKKILYRKMRVELGDKSFHKLIALNATPISDLGQVYNWCSLFTPGLYGSKRLFEAVHVDKQDHWGNVLSWKDEEALQENMERFSVDTDEDVKLPDLLETEIPYDLSEHHFSLYKQIEKAQLDSLPEDKLELALNSMFSILQRAIITPEEFWIGMRSPVLDFIDSYLEQLGDEGVLIYTRHVSVSRMLANYIPDCVAIYGGVTKPAREQAFKDLQSGKVKRLVGNLDSLGVGLNLQMLNHIIYVELPFRSDKLTQSLGRAHRQGQTKTCFANYPLAKNTLQYQIYHKLLKNKDLIDSVMNSKEDVLRFLSE